MHPWYWEYQYPDFIDLDEAGIYIDSYLVLVSDYIIDSANSFMEGVFLSSAYDGSIQYASGQFNEIPNLGNVDVLKQRIQNQLDYSRNKDVFSPSQPAHARLDTPALRQELVDRYRASGDTTYVIRKVALGTLKGEDRIIYPASGKVIKPSTYLLDLL